MSDRQPLVENEEYADIERMTNIGAPELSKKNLYVAVG